MAYFNELIKSMEWIGQQKKSIFIGQSVEFPGTAMYNSLVNVPKNKRKELPVAEYMQMGMSIGLGLNGYIPISIFPRWNFLLLATEQIVNHLDKLPMMGYNPKVIIRTSVGSITPLDPQHQHKYNFTEAFKLICKNINIVELTESEMIFPEYQIAYTRTDNKSTILVEWMDKYNEK